MKRMRSVGIVPLSRFVLAAWCVAAPTSTPAASAQTGQVPGATPLGATAADQAVPRSDQNSMTAHRQLLEKAKRGRIDLYFEGDSIVRRWGATDYPDFLANWQENFFGWNAANFGWGADRTQNILWRL
jgi:hypothetical protein